MKIPTSVSQQGLGTSGTGPSAQGADFGAAVGRGLKGLGQGAVDLGSGAAAIVSRREAKEEKERLKLEAAEERSKKIADATWASSARNQHTRHMARWMSDPANHLSSDYLPRYEEESRRARELYGVDAPSSEALLDYEQGVDSSDTSRFGSVANRTAANKMQDDLDKFEGAYYENLNAHRELMVDDPGAAYSSMVESYSRFVSDTNRIFEGLPQMAKKEIDKLTQETLAMFLEVGQYDHALNFLNEYAEGLDSETRLTWKNRIQKGQDFVVPARKKGEFEDRRASSIHNARKGAGFTILPNKDYDEIYGSDKAAEYQRQDQNKVEAYNWAWQLVDRVQDLAPNKQAEELEKVNKGIKDPIKQAAFDQVVRPAFEQSAREYQQDPVAWLSKNNSIVKEQIARQDAAEDPNEPTPDALEEIKNMFGLEGEDAVDFIKNRNRELKSKSTQEILRYQGYPQDPNDPNKDMYLNLPPHERHILTKSQAEYLAGVINQASPEEVISTINRVLDQYPDQKHKMMMFKDLSGLPREPIRQEYQLLFQNKDEWWIDSYVAAIQNAAPVKDLSSISRAEITGLIGNHPEWMKFQQAMVGDNLQRAGDLAGFKKGLELYASSMIVQGLTNEEAVEASISKLIKSTMGMAEIEVYDDNHQFVVVPRKKSDGSVRTDEEVTEIGRRASIAMGKINPTALPVDLFPFTKGLPLEESNVMVFDTIMERGFWQLSSDGSQGILYVKGEDGFPFPLRDKLGNLFKVEWDQLPNFEEKVTRTFYTEIGGQVVEQTSEVIDSLPASESNRRSRVKAKQMRLETWDGFIREPN